MEQNMTAIDLYERINDLLLLMSTFPLDKLKNDITTEEICAISYIDKFIVPQSHENKGLFNKQLELHLVEYPNKRVAPGAIPRIRIMDSSIYVQVNLRLLFTRGDLTKHNLYHYMRRRKLVPDLAQKWEYFVDLYLEHGLSIHDTINLYDLKMIREPAGKDIVNDIIESWMKTTTELPPTPETIGISLREFNEYFDTKVISAKIHNNQVIESSISNLAESLLDGEQTRLRLPTNMVYTTPIEYYIDDSNTLIVERTVTWATK